MQERSRPSTSNWDSPRTVRINVSAVTFFTKYWLKSTDSSGKVKGKKENPRKPQEGTALLLPATLDPTAGPMRLTARRPSTPQAGPRPWPGPSAARPALPLHGGGCRGVRRGLRRPSDGVVLVIADGHAHAAPAGAGQSGGKPQRSTDAFPLPRRPGPWGGGRRGHHFVGCEREDRRSPGVVPGPGRSCGEGEEAKAAGTERAALQSRGPGR